MKCTAVFGYQLKKQEICFIGRFINRLHWWKKSGSIEAKAELFSHWWGPCVICSKCISRVWRRGVKYKLLVWELRDTPTPRGKWPSGAQLHAAAAAHHSSAENDPDNGLCCHAGPQTFSRSFPNMEEFCDKRRMMVPDMLLQYVLIEFDWFQKCVDVETHTKHRYVLYSLHLMTNECL